MRAFPIEDPDWVTIRQSISISLVLRKRIAIRNAVPFISGNPQFAPVLDDIHGIIRQAGWGDMAVAGNDIVVEPAPIRDARCQFYTGPHSSVVDVLLTLAPALSRVDFRSVLNITGVTHRGSSITNACINETLFALLESIGFTATSSLKRFGFYGTGGGIIEAKVYPLLPAKDNRLNIPTGEDATVAINGARISIAKIATTVAEREKAALCEALQLAPDRVSIIEVMDADGPGHCVTIYLASGDFPLVIAQTFDQFDDTGEAIVDERASTPDLRPLIDEARGIIATRAIPGYLLRELIPFAVASHAACDHLFDRESRPAREYARFMEIV